jgi:hypothetical protein
MDDSNDPANSRFVASSGKMMSPRGRFVVAIFFSIISIGLAIIIADRAFTAAMLSVGRKSGAGTVTKVEQTRSRSATTYWVSYSFDVGDGKYERRSMFGLLRHGTQIYNADREAFAEGASIEVVYSSLDPRVNAPVNDPYRNDKSVLIVIGALLFGFLAVNLFKNLKKGE